MSNLRLSRPHTAKLAGFSAAILLALAGGCGSSDSDAIKQIQKAEQTVGALTTEGTFASIADDYRRRQLNEIHDSMNKLAGDGPETVRAAALSIASRAKAGIAALDTKVAVAADRTLDGHLADLRVGLNTFTLQKSIAENNSGAGTQDLIKTLQGSLDSNKQAAEAARKEAATNQAAVDELSTRVKAVSAQAAAKRQEASSIAAEMQGATATQGLEILKRSTAVTAQADALDQQAGDLATGLGIAQAELARARSKAAALDEQTRRIQADIAGAQTRLEEERKLADSAGKAAEAAAAAIRQKYAELGTFRSGTLEPAHQAAVASAQKAVDLSKQATSKTGGNAQSVAGGNTGKLATASMQQNYADALVSQARAFDQLAGTLALLASSQPPLPGAAEYGSAAEAARKSADDTLTQARELYSAIRESIDGIGEEKLKTRLSETSRILGELSSKQGVKAPEPAAPSSSNPAAAPGDGAEVNAVRAVLDQYHDKIRSEDFGSIINDLTTYKDDAQREFAKTISDLIATVKAFDAACQEKLNISAQEALGPMGAMAQGITEGVSKDKDRTGADYKITVSGDSATAVPTDGRPEKLVKKDGRWMMTMDDAGMPPQLVGQLKPMIPVLEQLTVDIKSGKITAPEQIQTALMAKLGGSMRPNRGGRPGGGGGGGGTDDPNK